MEELVLNNRRVKLIDGEIYAWKPIKNPYWRKCCYNTDKDGYKFVILSHKRINKNYKVHRIIYKFNNPDWDMTYSYDNEIDHIDNNRTNNNIENLRIVNKIQNSQNRPAKKGYHFSKQKCKYQAEIVVNKKKRHIGFYDTEEEAREAYLNAKEIYHIH